VKNKNKYTIKKTLGKGGNGIVYEVVDSEGNRFAKKVLKNIKSEKNYERFKSEIEVLNELKNKKGIVEIVDYHFPDEISNNDFPYYIMPIGIAFKDYIKTAARDQIFEVIFELCDALEYLHSQDITHRDIKPDNVLIVNNSPVFSDFGLANFPRKIKVSALNESIGPKWTIAPEMKRISSVAEFKRADIYSFAKTIWMILTQQWLSFDGQYIPNSNISIDKFVEIKINKGSVFGVWDYFSIVLLNRLLAQSTDNDPQKRPSASEFNKQFRYWHSSNDNYHERNPYEWEDALVRIFPISIPLNSKWVKLKEIYNVLKIIFESYDSLNHCFYPEYGGNDFNKIAIKKDFLLIDNNLLLKPKALYFESIGDLDYSYFILECEKIEPIFSQEDSENHSEDLYMDDKGSFHKEEKNGFHDISRYFQGKFLITKKTSIINKLQGSLDAYDGIQNKMSINEYRKLIEKVKNQINIKEEKH
jgi:serine/threonine protein kinase